MPPERPEVHGPPQRKPVGGYVANLQARSRATPEQIADGSWVPYQLIPPVLDTTPRSFADMKPPGYWSGTLGRFVEVRQVTPEEFWNKN